MAIYRTGQASMDAQGYITGYDTKWREQLTLIRPGATIVFLTQPLQVAVITEVINDTGMRAISTGGAVVDRSNYVILLHDSITVDGLAQDVAETLRYYQSKETIIEEAIEFFKDFDLKSLQNLVNQIKDAAEKTAADRAATEQLRNETNQIKSDTNTIKQQTQQIKDSALTEVNSARDQGVLAVNQTKDQAVSEMNQIKSDVSGLKNEAVSARDSAKQHMTDAQSAKNAAETAKAGAVTARNEAEEFAKSLNAENLLRKDANLSDLTNIEGARKNLSAFYESGSNLSGVDLNTLTGTKSGIYFQGAVAGATPELNYPERTAGNLVVLRNNANSVECCIQFYYPYSNTANYYSRYYNSIGGVFQWSAWNRWVMPRSDDPFRTFIGLGTTSWPAFAALTTDGVNGIFAKGRNLVSGATFTSQYYDASGALKGQGEFRSDVNGTVTVVNRGMTSSDTTYFFEFRRTGYLYAPYLETASSATNPLTIKSANPCIKFQETDQTTNNSWFMVLDGGNLRINKDTTGGSVAYNFKADGRLNSSGGYELLMNADWSGLNNPTNRAVFVAGSTNGPSNATYAGIHIGYFENYATQYAARNNAFFGRCLEAGAYGDWKKFALENNDIVNYAYQSGAGTANDTQTTKAVSFINGGTTYNLPATYGVLAGFGNGATSAAGCYVGQLCWDKSSGSLYSRVRNDGQKVWLDWLKVTTAAVSDENLKDIKGNLNVEGALDNISRMEFKLFRYLKDSPERSTRRGVIAQQVRNIDREYTTKVGDQLHLDTTPMLLDGLAAIKALRARDVENKERISKLEKEIEELKAAVSALINKPTTLES